MTEDKMVGWHQVFQFTFPDFSFPKFLVLINTDAPSILLLNKIP